MTAELICEGACNPQRHWVEEMVRRVTEPQSWTPGYVPDDVRLGLRSLRHTIHRQEGVRFVCTECHTERRYGHTG